MDEIISIPNSWPPAIREDWPYVETSRIKKEINDASDETIRACERMLPSKDEY